MLPGGNAPIGPIEAQSNNTVLISAPADAVSSSRTPVELQNFWSAACYVAATVALIKQRYPQLSPALVARALAMSARYRPHGGYSPSVGFGVLDTQRRDPRRGDAGPADCERARWRARHGRGDRALRRRAAGGDQRAAARRASRLPVLGAIAVGAVLLGTGAALSARRLWKRSQDQRGGSLQVVPAYAGEPTSVQPDPWAAYPAPPAPWNPAPQAPRDRAPQAPPW